MKKTIFGSVLAVVMLLAVMIFGAQLVSVEQALKDMMPAGKATLHKHKLNAEQIAEVNKMFKEELIKKGEEDIEYQVYMGKEGNAVIDSEQGKWGIIEMIVLLDSKTGKVINLEVLSSSEKRGRPIVMRSFLKPFCGKGPDDKIVIGKGINGVSGATISSESAAHIVKRAIAVHKILLLDKK